MSICWRIRASRSVSPIVPTATYSGERPDVRAPGGQPASGMVVGAGADRGAGLLERRQNTRQIALRDEHLAGLRALVAGDHAAALHHVDEPSRARVADPQAALEHRG